MRRCVPGEDPVARDGRQPCLCGRRSRAAPTAAFPLARSILFLRRGRTTRTIRGIRPMLHVGPAFSRIGQENAFAVLAKAVHPERQGRDIINLGIGSSPISPRLRISSRCAVRRCATGSTAKPAATGIRPLREAVAADLAVATASRSRPSACRSSRRQGDDVYGDRHVRRAGGRDRLPRPGLPIYRWMIEYTGARPVRRRCAKRTALRFRPTKSSR